VAPEAPVAPSDPAAPEAPDLPSAPGGPATPPTLHPTVKSENKVTTNISRFTFYFSSTEKVGNPAPNSHRKGVIGGLSEIGSFRLNRAPVL
jgi:hypothetical protein